MQHSQELAQEIRARIGELEADLEAHRRALAVLEEPPAHTQPRSNGGQHDSAPATKTVSSRPVANGRSVSRSAPATPKPGRRPVVSAEAVFDALNEGNDQAAVIAHEFGVSTATVRQRLEQLEQAGRVSRSGERRGTRWRSHAA